MEHALNDLFEAFREFDALRVGPDGSDAMQTAQLDAIEPSFAGASTVDILATPVRQALQALGISTLYQHQSDAIRLAVESASNIVLQAPTASGKSLAFQLPMLNTLANDPRGHALMIYPTKALALDQRDQLHRLAKEIPGRKIESWFYDGDVDQETRAAIRAKPPAILLTNVDMLHKTFLGNADLWHGFLSNLRWVIVDEIHEYRGYFGSNVSMILRRFSHHLSQLDAHPQFFLSSATAANALEHAEQLTGLSFTEVDAASSMRPSRQFWFVDPSIPVHQYWQILQLRAVNAGLACLATGRSALIFCPSRKFAEECHRMAMRRADELIADGTQGIDRDAIKVFKAGLSAEMRHEIQEGLKGGSVRLAFTTNALELGIDIGGLDGVILAGFPDSMMSAWQRIGRAGRRWNAEAFVLYLARNNPMDSFYAANLEAFLEKPLDDLVINPGNEELIRRHVPCLLFESDGIEGGREILGNELFTAAEQAIKRRETPVRAGRWRPHMSVDIRGGGGGMFDLMSGGKAIGTMSGHQRFREAYPRAIYMHGGSTYRVESVTSTGSGGEINLVTAEPHLSTRPTLITTVSIQDIFAGNRWAVDDSAISAFYGNVTVTEVLASVQEVNDLTSEVTDQWVPGDDSASARFSKAHACWLQVEDETADVRHGLTALQHLLRIGAQFTIPVDPHDMFPHATPGESAVYLIESYPGGIGVARKTLDRWRAMLEAGIGVAENCSCVKGCPNCLVPPRARDDFDKRAGITLARQLIAATDAEPTHQFEGGLWAAAS